MNWTLNCISHLPGGWISCSEFPMPLRRDHKLVRLLSPEMTMGVMRTFSLSRAARYSVAVLSVAIAAALRLALDPILGEVAPFLLFYLPVILAAWFGGLGPGLLATTLSLLLGDYLFMSPRYSIFRYENHQDMVSLVLVGLYGTTVSILADRLRKSFKAEIESKER